MERKVSSESQRDQQKKKMGRPRKYDEGFRKNSIGTDEGLPGRHRAGLSRGAKRRPMRDSVRRIAELERLVARQALELDFFFKGALRIEENRRKQGRIPASRLRANPAR